MDLLQDIDTELFMWINGHHGALVDGFMYDFSGKMVWGPMYAAILYALIRTYGWRRGVIFAVCAIVVVALSDQLCATVIRPMAERLRPANPANPLSSYVHIVSGYRGGLYGFPSCHAANTIGAALFISLVFKKRRVWTFMFAWALMNCYSRLYLGVHYPGDLLAGAVVGAVCATTVWFVCRYCLNRFSAEGVRPQRDIIFHIGTHKFCPCDVFIAIGLVITLAMMIRSVIITLAVMSRSVIMV